MTTVSTSLAAEINREHEQCEQAFTSAVEHAIRCGELLEEAKAQVQHGEWLPWLADHFAASERTARGYMRLAANRQRVADLDAPSVRAALAELSEPRDDQPDPRPERTAPAADTARLEALEAVVARGLRALRADLRRLYAQGAHTALGYPDWPAFVAAEFPMPAGWDAESAEPLRALLLEPTTAEVA